MLFLIGKLFWIALQPGNLLSALLVLGVVWLWASRRRRGFALVVLAAVGFAVVTLLPVGEWAVAPLESRFPPPAHLPEQIDGIILLGGAVDPSITLAHGQVALNDAAERVTATLALARRYPAARILLSGGSGAIARVGLSEAAATARLLTADGLDAGRLLLEERSRTTYENAVYGRDLVRPQPREVWLLVTSAAHMPRAVGCFRRVGWEVLPYPVDYRTDAALALRGGLRPNLDVLDYAAHEWLGLLAYRLLGEIGALFPGPEAAMPSSSMSER